MNEIILNSYPVEVIEQILVRIPYPNILRFRRTCRLWKNLMKKISFWNEKSQLEFGSSLQFKDQTHPEDGYVYTMTWEYRIYSIGSERFASPFGCVIEAFHKDDLNLALYFLQTYDPSQYLFLRIALGEIEYDESLLRLSSISVSTLRIFLPYMMKKGKLPFLEKICVMGSFDLKFLLQLCQKNYSASNRFIGNLS